MSAYLWVAAGSAIGGAGRYWLAGVAARLLGETFPFGTLAVNVLGSCFIGWFATVAGDEGRLLISPEIRRLVMPGLCGGFTTFSTFSLETLNLARDGEWMRAGANIALSLALCLAGVWLGHALALLVSER